jgi:CBS domain-containing protein
MRKNLITATPDIKLTKARETMHQHQINCLPVVEEKKLMGIITTKDL